MMLVRLEGVPYAVRGTVEITLPSGRRVLISQGEGDSLNLMSVDAEISAEQETHTVQGKPGGEMHTAPVVNAVRVLLGDDLPLPEATRIALSGDTYGTE